MTLFPDNRLPCITLHRPWADFVAIEWKTCETRLHRRFASLVGRRIGIHAGMHFDRNAIEAARAWMTPWQLERFWERGQKPFQKESGKIFCTARVARFRELAERDSLAALIDCGSVTRYGLDLTDLQSSPIARMVKGGQGIFYVEIS